MLALPTDAAGRSRLLPASLPFRHFAAGAVFQLAGWLLLAFAPEGVAAYTGGLGPSLAALHAFTLGALTMTALGAGLQLLPVATVQPVRAVGLAKLLWWLLCGSLTLFIAGVASVDTAIAAAGAIGTGVALTAHAGLIAANLLAARRFSAMIAYAWCALVALLAVIASGPALALQWRLGWLADPRAVALSHLIVACYGFLGLLTVGYSYLLVSMFMVAKAPPERAQRTVLALGATAIAGSVGLAFTGVWPIGVAVFALLGLAAAAAYSVQMMRLTARRRSRVAPWSLALMRFAWFALPASVALGAAIAAAGAAGAGAELGVGHGARHAVLGALLPLPLSSSAGQAVFVVLTVLGWLVSFMLAVALRIVPFLASVHAKLRHGRLPLSSAMTPAAAARAVAIGHPLAVVTLLGGVIAGSDPLVSLAGLIGAAASLAFIAFLVGVLRRASAPGPGAAGSRGRVSSPTPIKRG
jgi:hypothetical protein